LVTYRNATAPSEVVRLAILPFESDAETKPLAEGLLLDAGSRLSKAKVGRTKLTVVPLGDAVQNRVEQPTQARTMLGATLSLSGKIQKENGKFAVSAYLIDTRSLVHLREWRATYSDGELNNVPLALAGIVTGFFLFNPLIEVQARSLYVPFFKAPVILDMGMFTFFFFTLVIVGASNAVNLTDGLDGLAIVPVMIAGLSFGLIAYLVGNAVFSDYLQINYVAGTGELAVLCGAVFGAGLGFLWFNAPPASIFMGDTGSLALGGMLGSIAVAVKHEIVLAVIGGLFVLEAVSVIVQVASFKLTGKRIFRMAPIHHHFEQLGWTEPQIVIRFWIISVMLALAGLSTLKLR